MSFEFQSTLVNVTPNFRISGANIGGLRILQNGDIKVARLVVTNDRDIQFALSGPYEVGDPDAIYASLSSDLYELVPWHPRQRRSNQLHRDALRADVHHRPGRL